MFKKVLKKNPLVLEAPIEEVPTIKKLSSKKKSNNWITAPVKSSSLAAAEINSFIKSEEDIGNYNIPIEVFPQLYGRDFNESVEELVKSIQHKGEIESLDSLNSSNEELENIDLSSENENWKHEDLYKNKKRIQVLDFKKFLEEKIKDVKVCKEIYGKRLHDIKQLQNDSQEILISLHQSKPL